MSIERTAQIRHTFLGKVIFSGYSPAARVQNMFIFDIDDTLVNHSQAEQIAAIQFGKEFADIIPCYADVDFALHWNTIAQEHIKSFLQGTITFQEQRRRRVRTLFQNDNLSPEKADEIFAVYLRHYESAWQLFDDVMPFFLKHPDLEYVALSDGSQKQQELKLQQTGIRQYFKFVLTAESEGMSKPDPRFFIRACHLAGKEPEDVYYVGDNLEKDALGAIRAGLNGIWLNRTKMKTTTKLQSIETLFELDDILEKKSVVTCP